MDLLTRDSVLNSNQKIYSVFWFIEKNKNYGQAFVVKYVWHGTP